MRTKLPKRMRELKRVARELQKLGWVVSHIGLECADSEAGMIPVGSLVVRYDPHFEKDIL